MLRSALDEAAIERAAEAIFNFDEDLTDKCQEETGITFTEPRWSWSELCLQEPETAIGYRGRARAALLAAIGAA
jgi:hypothetical protein